jgi:DNA-directed RNA polymerase subunit alpha
VIEINRPKIKFSQGDHPNHCVLKLEPLERGYGQTLGNAFRRVLLASLPGSAVCAVKIDGVLHEFCSVPGVLEDVTEIILNLKKLIVNVHNDQPVTIRIEAQGPCEVTAADIPNSGDLTVIEKSAHICHVPGNIKLGMDITFKRGRGYLLAEDHKDLGHPIGTILVDSQFSPVVKVMFNVEDARVGQDINFDKLTLQVWTNGSMKPTQAIELAGKFLRAHVDLFLNLEEEEDTEVPATKEELVMVSTQKKEAPAKSHNDILIKDLEFSVRSRNCLKKAGIHCLGELVNKKAGELLEIKNFGKKSLKEVREKLNQFSLTLPGEENGGGID